MNTIFNGTENVLIYMDDILLFSSTVEEHKILLKKAFEILNTNSISINFEKGKFNEREIEFLGHKINENGITPVIAKLDSYECFKPKTKKQLQKLLGFINWFRPFVKELSILTANLYEKLKSRGNKVIWTQADELEVRRIFEKIRNCSTLHHPNLNKEFQLKCDASDQGIGSILLQEGKIIGYYSKKYNIQERNYTTVEKEILAILKSLEHFKHLIFNTKINIETDNKNLTFSGELSKRAYRWKLLIEEFDYTLNHIDAQQNTDADLLSRYLLKIDSESSHKCKTYLINLPEIKHTIPNENKNHIMNIRDD
ncbi:Transposon Tf2-9 polyprotein [Dictyocoela muelleri]|nr:Transposon Tf2-9 polyprotein [Dictyocoela muelleri]